MTDTDPLTLDLHTLRSTSIASLVRSKIEEEIISGKRQGRDHLTEQELTRAFQVSRGPVREALRALEGQGLLEQKKNRGWFVKLLSKQEVAQVFEMRDILDKGMPRLLVSKQTEPEFVIHLAKLEDLVKKMDTLIDQGDIRSYARLNQDFHDELLAVAGNDHLAKTYRNMMCELASHVVKSLELNNAMCNSNAEHREIVEALKAGDESSLCNMLESHRKHTQERMGLVAHISERDSPRES